MFRNEAHAYVRMKRLYFVMYNVWGCKPLAQAAQILNSSAIYWRIFMQKDLCVMLTRCNV